MNRMIPSIRIAITYFMFINPIYSIIMAVNGKNASEFEASYE